MSDRCRDCGGSLPVTGRNDRAGECVCIHGSKHMTAKTGAQRQQELRKKRQAAGITEIRGLYAPAGWHREIRQMVREWMAKQPLDNTQRMKPE